MFCISLFFYRAGKYPNYYQRENDSGSGGAWMDTGQPVNYLRMIYRSIDVKEDQSRITINRNERKMKEVWWCRNGRPPSTAWIFRRIGGRGGLGGYSINLSSHCGGSTSTQISEILSSGWVRLRSKIRRLNILRIACVNMVGQTHQTKSRDRTSRWLNNLDLAQISMVLS